MKQLLPVLHLAATFLLFTFLPNPISFNIFTFNQRFASKPDIWFFKTLMRFRQFVNFYWKKIKIKVAPEKSVIFWQFWENWGESMINKQKSKWRDVYLWGHIHWLQIVFYLTGKNQSVYSFCLEAHFILVFQTNWMISFVKRFLKYNEEGETILRIYYFWKLSFPKLNN